ncbi:DUF1269 domain-containing protein [Nocardioides sp. LHG3406-4]|uniref:DUF1269 domain-containing protein n=1 Tax=Nocardioides sp. LHG3406-4 TaxID=2804575 RepID=UPI003CF98458
MSNWSGKRSRAGRQSNRGSQRRSAVDPTAPALTVWIYDSALGAAAGEVRLRNLRKRNALEVHDAITVSWMPGCHEPRIGHLRLQTSAAAIRGSALGGLVGLIFLPPSPGVAAGGGIAALARRLRGTGIDQMFLEEMKAHLHPETSALLMLSGEVDLDQVRPVIERGLVRGDVVLMHAQLPHDASEALRDAVRQLQGNSHGT